MNCSSSDEDENDDIAADDKNDKSDVEGDEEKDKSKLRKRKCEFSFLEESVPKKKDTSILRWPPDGNKEKNYSILSIFPYFVLGFIGMIILRNIGDQIFIINEHNNYEI